MNFEIGDYKVTLDGELQNNRFRGDITIILGGNTKKYEGVIFNDISCILKRAPDIREAYIMGISENLECGRRRFDKEWQDGFCLFRYYRKIVGW